MTENKRFTYANRYPNIIKSDYDFYDNGKGLEDKTVVDLLNNQDMMIKSQDKLIRTLNETILRQTNRIKEFASEEEVDLLTKREKENFDLRTRILELIVENNRLQFLINDLGGEEMKRQMGVILNDSKNKSKCYFI